MINSKTPTINEKMPSHFLVRIEITPIVKIMSACKINFIDKLN